MDIYPLPEEDAITKQGFRVDVKSTKYPNGHLLAVLGKNSKRTDLYVLVIGSFPKYRIAGQALSKDLFKEENIKDFGHGKGYALSQSKLK